MATQMIKKLAIVAAGICGLALIVAGVGMVYLPAALVVGGGALVALAVTEVPNDRTDN